VMGRRFPPPDDGSPVEQRRTRSSNHVGDEDEEDDNPRGRRDERRAAALNEKRPAAIIGPHSSRPPEPGIRRPRLPSRSPRPQALRPLAAQPVDDGDARPERRRADVSGKTPHRPASRSLSNRLELANARPLDFAACCKGNLRWSGQPDCDSTSLSRSGLVVGPNPMDRYRGEPTRRAG
jgi:hypothetical protein